MGDMPSKLNQSAASKITASFVDCTRSDKMVETGDGEERGRKNE